MTQERFAEALDISVESVRQYESDKIMPSDDVVTRMVEVSGQPVIGYWHLLNKSRVAADILPDVQECSLEQAVIKLLCRIRQFAENNNTNRLMDISEDGIIDETERPDFDRIIKELDGIEINIKLANEDIELADSSILKRCAKYNFEMGDYLIRCAVSANEIIREGKTLQHCVGG